MNVRALAIALAGMLAGMPAQPAYASVRGAESFRIGSSGVLCTAEGAAADAVLATMFDRKLNIVCRDAAAPIGRLYMLRVGRDDPATRLASVRDNDLSCGAPAELQLGSLSGVRQSQCTGRDTGLKFHSYSIRQGGRAFLVEGLAGYDSALRLALQSLVLDREVPGAVEAAITEAGDPTAFARLQAGILDPDRALAEGYGRNNIGSFAEAAEFFDTLVQRSQSGDPGFVRSAEYLANEALQQSNLGKIPEADSRFRAAIRAHDPSDAYVSRLIRNFRAMHSLNQRQGETALTILSEDMPSGGAADDASTRLATGFLDRPITQRLNNDDVATAAFGGVDVKLTFAERVAILDVQKDHLEGVARRLLGQLEAAAQLQSAALGTLGQIRNGELGSLTWLKAAVLIELAAISEATGKPGDATRQLREAIEIYSANYPGSPSLIATRARLANTLLRQGNRGDARSEFRSVVKDASTIAGADMGIRSLLSAYFGLLAETPRDLEAGRDFFAASQILIRPGVAQTQAVFARELSGGSDEASRLFRQSVTLSRDVVRADGEIARLSTLADPRPEDRLALDEARARRNRLANEQALIVSQLAEFPQYRALSNDRPDLEALQKSLGEGEAYYKFVVAGDLAFGFYVAGSSTVIVPISSKIAEIERDVVRMRDSIAKYENGQLNTYPFDVEAGYAVFQTLFGPVSEDLKSVTHLIFEPDGPMLQLPPNLLIADRAGVDAYLARIADPDADQFDLTGIEWLGRKRIVSTAVSARSFMDVRKVAPSRAARPYLGLGQNAVPRSRPASAALDCEWPLDTWSRPISGRELEIGAAALGAGPGSVILGPNFTDEVLRSLGNLSEYRIVHFATHGLVTAPRPQCPARPALLTSFGSNDSDGLLSFKEIFDLRLDADTVILSACDTAGMATVEATRDAGISTGGNFALDGLVRAFVGAGARSVVASHWPAPDDFQATEKLMTGLFRYRDMGIGEAMRRVQLEMMDDPSTSHPYYWSGFAIVGDASKPLSSR
jgi:tetratricopeptide (TPR) repeat protein